MVNMNIYRSFDKGVFVTQTFNFTLFVLQLIYLCTITMNKQ